jgi:hypothetical protein
MDDMRLKLILPEMKADCFGKPQRCPNNSFRGKHFQQGLVVKKALRDGQSEEGEARRYECLRGGCTFRAMVFCKM